MENRSSFFLLTTSVDYSQIKHPELKVDSGFSTFNSELSFKESIASQINHGQLV